MPVVDEVTVNSFDEFFEHELYQLQCGDDSPEESIRCIEEDSHVVQPTDFAPRTRISRSSKIPQVWRQGLWCLTQEPGIMVGKTRKNQVDDTFVSPVVLQNDFGIAQAASVASHVQYRTGSDRDNFFASPHAQDDFRFDRQETLSPTPMYQTLHLTENDAFLENWQREFQAFNLQSTIDDNGGWKTEGVHVPGYGDDGTSGSLQRGPTRYHYPFQALARSSSLGQSPTHITRTIQPHDGQTFNTGQMNTWDMEASNSPDGSHSSIRPYESQLPGAAAPELYSHRFLQTQRPTAPHRGDYPANLLAPLPQRRANKIIDGHFDNLSDGLGNRYPVPEEIGRAISSPPPAASDHQIMGTLRTIGHPLFVYPALPAIPVESDVDMYGRTHRRFRSYSCSPSPPLSPAFVPSHRSSQHNPLSKTHNVRRKSINKQGPIREIVAPLSANASPSRANRTSPRRSQSQPRLRSQARSRSVSSKPIRPSSKNKATVTNNTSLAMATLDTTFDFDFVNYTVQDSAKLLSEVAPSGSSKTKARREREAREKSEKIKEAAMNAVKRAGGDLRELQRRMVS